MLPKADKITENQLTPSNRVTEITRSGIVYLFYSKGAWDDFALMMPPAYWLGETRTAEGLEAAMLAAIDTGIARPYPSANEI